MKLLWLIVVSDLALAALFALRVARPGRRWPLVVAAMLTASASSLVFAGLAA